MSAIAFLSISLFVFLGILLALKINQSIFKPTSLQSLGTMVLYSVLVLGSCLSNFLSENYFPFYLEFGWIIGGFMALFLEKKQFSFKINGILKYFLCLFLTFCCYSLNDISFFKIISVFAMAFYWWGMWRLFVFFDRFPFTSFVVSMAWGLALFCIGGMMKTVPPAVLSQTLLLSVATLALNSWLVSLGQASMGKMSASLMGFLWGGIWVYFLSKGAVIQTVSFGSYYLFEGIFLLISFIKHRPLDTYLSLFLLETKNGSKALKIVFIHILILTSLAAMSINIRGNNLISVFLFFVGVILFDMYLRLKAIISPEPTWRELYGDLKNGLGTLVSTVNNTLKKQTDQQKKQTKTPAKPVRKKVPSQKKIQNKKKEKK